jgi:hypothetical protein
MQPVKVKAPKTTIKATALFIMAPIPQAKVAVVAKAWMWAELLE